MNCRSKILVCLSLAVVFMSLHTSMATVYMVGDSNGWSLGVDYATWTSDKTFIVGDTLVFSYGSSHTIDEVSESDYSSCSIGNVLASDNSGASNVPLNKAGKRYFVCGVIGHCSGGMKIIVDVKDSSSSNNSPTTTTTTTKPISFSSSVRATNTWITALLLLIGLVKIVNV
ncbi:blue copper protein [Impatiens glandulifera]|uniref:blue copper protein n=1 Tax=Impatiens glandulifera TaxID=253017 RepID=UPI001FB0B56F|nr:blue copper protein [Impatiens glandulifera]